MADVPWPSTLPNPKASGFSLVHKQMGNTLAFASGRHRVTRNRQISGFRYVVNIDVSFSFTPSEYQEFADFYDTYWKSFRPTNDKIAFTIPGSSFPWIAYPTSTPVCVRNDATWEVSFSIEAFVPFFGFSYSTAETDAVSPLWPQSVGWKVGASFSRISRDINSLEDNLLLSRAIAKDDAFVKGQLTLRAETIDDVFFIVEWWCRFLFCGALPFKLPSSVIDLGPINRQNAEDAGFYRGKIVTAPQISFDGYFGSVSFSVVLYPYVETFATVVEIAGDDGAIFATDTGDTFEGVL